MTAIQWLIGRFHYEGFIGTYCSEEMIKSKRQLMIEIIEQAKEIEKIQIIDACNQTEFEDIDGMGIHETITKGEQYFNKTYKNTNK
jgi:peroxiredoxin family protein